MVDVLSIDMRYSANKNLERLSGVMKYFEQNMIEMHNKVSLCGSLKCSRLLGMTETTDL